MNNYEIEFRKTGSAISLERYNIVAESLEDAIAGVKAEIPNDYGSELRYEFVSARETARAVLLPKAKTATRGR